MSVYSDASFLVSLFAADIHTPKAEAFASTGKLLIYSTWTRAEFFGAIGARFRQARLGQRPTLVRAEALFDRWCARTGPSIPVSSDDSTQAERLVRTRELKLRAPDALHLAMVIRVGTELVTFDDGMADAAEALGVTVHRP